MRTLTEKELRELRDTFNVTYRILYTNPNLETYEMVEFGDACIRNNKELTSQFVEYRKDFISSDREAAAYGIALKTLDLA